MTSPWPGTKLPGPEDTITVDGDLSLMSEAQLRDLAKDLGLCTSGKTPLGVIHRRLLAARR